MQLALELLVVLVWEIIPTSVTRVVGPFIGLALIGFGLWCAVHGEAQ